jgi:hypothetical protein
MYKAQQTAPFLVSHHLRHYCCHCYHTTLTGIRPLVLCPLVLRRLVLSLCRPQALASADCQKAFVCGNCQASLASADYQTSLYSVNNRAFSDIIQSGIQISITVQRLAFILS